MLSEFGRTPQLNGRGGRDHYPDGLDELPLRRQHPRRPGDRRRPTRSAPRPHDNPIEPPQVLASIYHGMGINLDTTMMPGPGDRPVRLVEAEPIRQLFG